MTWRTASVLAATAMALVSSCLSPLQAHADSAVAPKQDVITVSGKGWGHGKGMSQYGAYGAALAGLDYQEILDFYYAKTTLKTRDDGDAIRVWISSDSDNRTNVAPAVGLVLKDSAGKAYTLPRGAKYMQWRVSRSGSKRVLAFRNAAGDWVTRKTALAPTKVWSFSNTDSGTVTVALPGGTKRTYRGRIAVRFDGSALRTVNHVTMRNYLRSVVPSEMPASWHIEALKAQVVAARSYALRYEANLGGTRVYDICDTTACQVYSGTANEYAASDKAVDGTAGKVVTYDGSIALTMFSSSNGGWAADGGEPYLVAHKDPYDGIKQNSNRTWRVELTSAKIQKAYPTIGTLKNVRVTARDGDGTWGGRVDELKVTGSKGSVTVTGAAFRSTFGLKERYFTLIGGTVDISANLTRWEDEFGGAAGVLGDFVEELEVGAGLRARFESGELWWSEATGSHLLSGVVQEAYLAEGGADSALGFPRADVAVGSDGGSWADFEVGRITCGASLDSCVVAYG
jgi:SpoIID/LytB domain protein